MEEYKGKIPTNKNMVSTKALVVVIIVLFVSLILRYINVYTTFIEGFGYSLLIWTVVNVYDVVVMDICWFCHSPRFVFKGTEDIIKEYRNYAYHIKQGLLGQVIGTVVCLLIGVVVQFI